MFASSSRLLEDDGNDGFFPFKDSQYYAMWAIGTFSSLLSLIGSCTTLYVIRKQKATKLYHRLAFGLSVSDLISAIGLTMQPYLLPQDSGYPFAIGNQTTCNIVGSLFPFYFASCFQGIALAMSLFLMFFYKKEDRDLQHVLEPWSYILAFCIPGVYTVVCARLELFNLNPFMGVCGVFPLPPDCTFRNDADCIRSKETDFIAHLYYWAIAAFTIMGELWIIWVLFRSRRNDPGVTLFSHAYVLPLLLGGVPLVIIPTLVHALGPSKYPSLMYVWWLLFPIGGFLNHISNMALLCAPWWKYHESFCWVMRRVFSGDSPPDYQQQGGTVQDYWGSLQPYRHSRQRRVFPKTRSPSSDFQSEISPSGSMENTESPMVGHPQECGEENDVAEGLSLDLDDVAWLRQKNDTNSKL